MKSNTFLRWPLGWLLLLAALSWATVPAPATGQDYSKTTTQVTDTVNQPDENTTETHHQDSTLTEGRSGDTDYTKETQNTSDDSVTRPNLQQTENGYEGGASRKYEETHSTEMQAGNAGEDELGGTELQNGREVASGEVGASLGGKIENDLGSVDARVDAGASGNVQVGDNGVQAEGEAGISAEVNAALDKIGVGNEDAGASLEAKAKLEAMIGAEGKIGAYIDDKGITIGGEARAGAFISAQVEATFEAWVCGINTNVRVYAEGHAGLMAHAEAVVTIGFDGRVKFQLGAGVSIGLGFSMGIEFELDMSELMDRMGFTMAELLDWIEKFSADPVAYITDLFNKAVDSVKDAFIGAVVEAVEEVVDTVVNTIADAGDSLLDWITGAPPDSQTDGSPDHTTVTIDTGTTCPSGGDAATPVGTPGDGVYKRNTEQMELGQ